MTLSSISQSSLATNQANQQKSETAAKQSEKKMANQSSEKTAAENKFDDNVTLSQSTAPQSSAKVETTTNLLDATSVEKLQQKVSQAILTDSKTAISAQAITNPQLMQSLLAQ